MKKLWALVLFLLAIAPSAFAQSAPYSPPAFVLNSSTQTGPQTAGYLDITGTGINILTFSWSKSGSVSAGACALQGSADNVTYGTTIIAAQTVTSSGGPTALATGVTSNFIRIRCTTSIVGTGSVKFKILGWQVSPASSTVTVSGTVNVDPVANTIGLATATKQTDGTAKVQVYYGNSSTPIGATDIASVATASGAIVSGSIASGAIASGAYAAGSLNAAIPDPCTTGTKLYYVVNLTAAATVEIANAVSGEFWHICGVNLIAQGANKVILATDDTDGCGSLTAGLNGGTTAATGWSFAADGGGIALGNGMGTVMKSGTANHYLCIAPSTTAQLSGTIIYVSSTQ